MLEFIHYLAQQIVNNPDVIKITEYDESGLKVYKIKVEENDIGLLIGKGGKTIRSIRALVRAKAIKDGKRVKVEVDES